MVNEMILLRQGRQMVEIPREKWEAHLAQVPHLYKTRLGFASQERHLVRCLTARELPRIGEPIHPELICQELGLSLERVSSILNELGRNLFFLVRNEHGAVCWAYPVTVDPTPHHLTFGTGDKLYAA